MWEPAANFSRHVLHTVAAMPPPCMRSPCPAGCRNLLLTCKRLLRVYMAERALWCMVAWSFPRLTRDQGPLGPLPRPFAEQDSCLFSKLRLLQRVAGGRLQGLHAGMVWSGA